MRDRILFKEHNFHLIDFYSFYFSCENQLINDLYNYGLLEKGKLTKDTKRLILHHLILQICETLLNYKGKEKTVIYFSNQIPVDAQLLKYFNEIDLEHLFEKIVNKIKTVIPVRIHSNHLQFKEIAHSKLGKRSEIIARVKHTLDNTDLTQFSFSRTNAFTKRYDLTFLSKDYFNSIKTKQLLIT